MSISDLTLYRNKAHLELCLEMVKEAYTQIHQNKLDLATATLLDILETFEDEDDDCEKATIINFPRS